MGIFTFTARVHDLIYQKSNIEYRLLKLSRKLRDLQAYSATIANGEIKIGDLLNSPGSMMGRTMEYLGRSDLYAQQYMQQNAPYLQPYVQQATQGKSAQEQQMMQEYMMRQLYAQGRDRYAQAETRNLKMEEDRLAQEKERLETLGKEIEADLKAAKEGRDAAIKDMAPKYTFA